MPSSALTVVLPTNGTSALIFGAPSVMKPWCALNFICQICRKRPATEVHHLTYERVFNEMACDLLPVCSACHRAIHYRKPANDNSPEQMPLPFDDNE